MNEDEEMRHSSSEYALCNVEWPEEWEWSLGPVQPEVMFFNDPGDWGQLQVVSEAAYVKAEVRINELEAACDKAEMRIDELEDNRQRWIDKHNRIEEELEVQDDLVSDLKAELDEWKQAARAEADLYDSVVESSTSNATAKEKS